MATTKLSRWFDMVNEGKSHSTYTRDSWTIPDEGAEVWCAGWKRGQIIKPYGDGCHVYVGYTVYHCDEFMSILTKWEQEGITWGIEGVKREREQQVCGRWTPVESLEV